MRAILNNRKQGSQSKIKTLEQYHDYNSIVESGIHTSNVNNRKIRNFSLDYLFVIQFTMLTVPNGFVGCKRDESRFCVKKKKE